MEVAAYSDVGGRPRNEDTVRYRQLEPDGLCLVVADGLGGHGGGELASAAAAEEICAGWDGSAHPSALAGLIQRAHRRVQGMQTERCAMKTTAVALVLAEGAAGWAHAGDSRLYWFRDGKLAFQTRDHSASQIAVALGDITVDQIRFHEDRNRVLRALGQEGSLNVETGGEAPLGPGRHAFLLCTDGFWEYVLEREMEADLAAASTPGQWLERMRARLEERVSGSNDNHTAAAVWL